VTAALRATRLLLRQWRDDDVAAFAGLSADPAVMEYLLPLAGWMARKRAHS
jgi:RimJ/RimL family protein N-acetyltransferase